MRLLSAGRAFLSTAIVTSPGLILGITIGGYPIAIGVSLFALYKLYDLHKHHRANATDQFVTMTGKPILATGVSTAMMGMTAAIADSPPVMAFAMMAVVGMNSIVALIIIKSRVKQREQRDISYRISVLETVHFARRVLLVSALITPAITSACFKSDNLTSLGAGLSVLSSGAATTWISLFFQARKKLNGDIGSEHAQISLLSQGEQKDSEAAILPTYG